MLPASKERPQCVVCGRWQKDASGSVAMMTKQQREALTEYLGRILHSDLSDDSNVCHSCHSLVMSLKSIEVQADRIRSKLMDRFAKAHHIKAKAKHAISGLSLFVLDLNGNQMRREDLNLASVEDLVPLHDLEGAIPDSLEEAMSPTADVPQSTAFTSLFLFQTELDDFQIKIRADPEPLSLQRLGRLKFNAEFTSQGRILFCSKELLSSLNELDRFDCASCVESFDVWPDLLMHAATSQHCPKLAKQADAKAFICPTCKKGFTRKAYMLEHLARHRGLKDRECQLCKKKFYSTSYWRHMATVHAQQDKLLHECHVCHRRFPHSFRLKLHLQTHLSYEDRPYVCPHCPDDKRFTTMSKLRSHISQRHTSNKSSQGLLCPDCGALLANAASLNAHMKRHVIQETKEDQEAVAAAHLTIGACGSMDWPVAEVEIQSEAVLPAQQQQQEVAAVVGEQLIFHEEHHLRPDLRLGSGSVAEHTGPFPVDLVTKPHTCPECGKAFRLAKDLKRHIRVHTGEKPFRCVDCGKHFSSSSNLSEHRTLHTGRLPYQCDKCERKFRLWTTMKKHSVRCGPDSNPAAQSDSNQSSDYLSVYVLDVI